MKYTHVNIKAFSKVFSDMYSYLYDTDCNGNGINYAVPVEQFDYLFSNNDSFNRFVCAFNDYRKDFISSDREAAAFMLALLFYSINWT